MRPSATRLEDAVIRWGPTLIEDPDSAELLNLLPDIVDSRRGGTRSRRRRAGSPNERAARPDSLLDILGHADEFRSSTLRMQ